MSTESYFAVSSSWSPKVTLSDWQRFLLLSLFPAVLGTLGMGIWVSMEIERGVVHQAGSFTSLSVTSFVEPMVQDMVPQELTPGPRAALDRIFRDSPLSEQLVRVVIWGRDRRHHYESRPPLAGITGDPSGFDKARRGWVAAEVLSSATGDRWLHTFGPVRAPGTEAVIAVVEFFQTLDQFESRLASARQNSWMVVGLAMLVVYLVLGLLVRPSFATILAQKTMMAGQLVDLRELLRQNQALGRRIREASQRASTSHERLLREVGAELHDGPAQEISFALLRLEAREKTPLGSDHELVKTALENALKEIRALSSGLSLPELDGLTLAQAAAKAVQAHERRTGTTVEFTAQGDGSDAPGATKIAVYRVIQESLANAFRHAGGIDQRVFLSLSSRGWELSVADGGGPQREHPAANDREDHLGVSGMRERVESLGGTFTLEHLPEVGTVVKAFLPRDLSQEGA